MPLTPKCEGLLLQQIFCFAGEVQRYVGKAAVFPIATLGKADRMLRLTLRKESLEGGCRLIFTALGFHRNYLRAVLDQKSISLLLSA